MDNISVTSVKHLERYLLLCRFSSGAIKKIDIEPLLVYPAYADLRDPAKFKEFGLDETIFWSNGADIAPEWLYANGVDV